LAVSTRGRYLVVTLAVVSLVVDYLLTPVSANNQKACCLTPTKAFVSGGFLADGLVVAILLCVLFFPLGESKSGRYLLAALSVVILLSVLLSPLGLEERLPARGAAFATWMAWRTATGTLGVWLSYAALAALAWRPRGASIAAILGCLLIMLEFVADQARLMAWTAPPAGITALEAVSSVVVVGTLFLAFRVYRESENTVAT